MPLSVDMNQVSQMFGVKEISAVYLLCLQQVLAILRADRFHGIFMQVNDSLFRTGLSLEHSPAEVAAGALHAASLLLGVARELPYKGQLCWWDALGFSLTTVEKVGHALLDAILQQHRVLP